MVTQTGVLQVVTDRNEVGGRRILFNEIMVSRGGGRWRSFMLVQEKQWFCADILRCSGSNPGCSGKTD